MELAAAWAIARAGAAALARPSGTRCRNDGFQRRRRAPDRILTARALDGWNLRLVYYAPRYRTAFKEPVILCHGLGANSCSLDLDDRHSIAKYLAGRGFHAIVPNLRGREGSWPEQGPPARDHGYSFDDHAGFDAEAILATTLRVTGAQRAFWLGHSMGGMIGYVLAANEPSRIAGVVTLGAPAQMRTDRLRERLFQIALAIPRDPIPQRWLSSLLATVTTATFPPFLDMSLIRRNVDIATLRRAMVSSLVDVPRRLVRQFADWALRGIPISMLRGVEYLESIARVRAPLLCVAGSGDRLAPPEDVYPAFDLNRSGDRTWICLGGDAASDPTGGGPRGHADMILARDAPLRLFPVLSRWMEERARRTRGA
jgi:pimeloyl-ACP methyl ester carboxylesterase